MLSAVADVENFRLICSVFVKMERVVSVYHAFIQNIKRPNHRINV